MPNPTTALLPNNFTTPNVPNTGVGVQIVPANPQRNGLLICNTSGNIIWIGPSTVVFVAGTQQQGTISLNVNSSLGFGFFVSNSRFTMFPWIWTAAMFAQAAAGATNTITVLEF